MDFLIPRSPAAVLNKAEGHMVRQGFGVSMNRTATQVSVYRSLGGCLAALAITSDIERVIFVATEERDNYALLPVTVEGPTSGRHTRGNSVTTWSAG